MRELGLVREAGSLGLELADLGLQLVDAGVGLVQRRSGHLVDAGRHGLGRRGADCDSAGDGQQQRTGNTNKIPYRIVSRVRTVRPGSRTQRGSGDLNGGRGWLALTALRGKVAGSRCDAGMCPSLPSVVPLIREFGSANPLQHALTDLTTG